LIALLIRVGTYRPRPSLFLLSFFFFFFPPFFSFFPPFFMRPLLLCLLACLALVAASAESVSPGTFVELDAETGTRVTARYTEATDKLVVEAQKTHHAMQMAYHLWQRRLAQYERLAGLERLARTQRDNAVRAMRRAAELVRARHANYTRAQEPVKESVKCIEDNEKVLGEQRRNLTGSITPRLNHAISRWRWRTALHRRERSLSVTHQRRAAAERTQYTRGQCESLTKRKLMMMDLLLQLTPKPKPSNGGAPAPEDDPVSADVVDNQRGEARGLTSAPSKKIKDPSSVTTTLLTTDRLLRRTHRVRAHGGLHLKRSFRKMIGRRRVVAKPTATLRPRQVRARVGTARGRAGRRVVAARARPQPRRGTKKAAVTVRTATRRRSSHLARLAKLAADAQRRRAAATRARALAAARAAKAKRDAAARAARAAKLAAAARAKAAAAARHRERAAARAAARAKAAKDAEALAAQRAAAAEKAKQDRERVRRMEERRREAAAERERSRKANAERERKRKALEAERRRKAAELERKRKIGQCQSIEKRFRSNTAAAKRHATAGTAHEAAARKHAAIRDEARRLMGEASKELAKLGAKLAQCKGNNADAVANMKRALALYTRAQRVHARRVVLHRLAYQRWRKILSEMLSAKQRLADAKAAYVARKGEADAAKASAKTATDRFHTADLVNGLAATATATRVIGQRVWEEFKGQTQLASLSANRWDQAYVVTRRGDGIHYSPEANTRKWLALPGASSVRQLLIDCESTMWKLDKRGVIWRMKGRALWSQLPIRNRGADGKPFRFRQFAVAAEGALWAVAEDSRSAVYKYDPSSKTFQSRNASMASVAVGCDGDVWALGPNTNKTQAGADLFHLAREGDPHARRFNYATMTHDDLTNTWVRKGTAMVSVSISRHGAYALGARGDVFHYAPPKAAAAAKEFHWYRYDAKMSALEISNDGVLFGLTAKTGQLAMYVKRDEEMPRGYRDFLEVKRRGAWDRIDEGLGKRVREITAGKDGTLYATTRLPAQALEFNFRSSHWRPMPGANLVQITRACDGSMAGIDTAGELVGYDASADKWVAAQGKNVPKLKRIKMCGKDEVYGTDAEGVLHAYWPSRGTWYRVPLVEGGNKGSAGTDVLLAEAVSEGKAAKGKAAKDAKGKGDSARVVSFDCGCGGHLLVSDAAGRLWSRKNGARDSFSIVAKGVKEVTMGHEVYLTDRDDRLFRFHLFPRVGVFGKKAQWEFMFIRMTKISAGRHGELYGRDLYGDSFAFRPLHRSPSWVYLDGEARTVHVGNRDTVYAVTPKGGLVMRDFKAERWMPLQRTPGKLEQVTVGCDGVLYGLTRAGGGAKSHAAARIWRLHRSASLDEADLWTELSDGGPAAPHVFKIAAGHAGELWGLNRKTDKPMVYSFARKEWIEIAGAATPQARSIDVACDGSAWIVSLTDGRPYRYSHESGSWHRASRSRALEVAAGLRSGYIISPRHRLYRWEREKLTGRWVALGRDHVYDVSAGGDGAVYAVDVFDRVIMINRGEPQPQRAPDGSELAPTDGVPPPAVVAYPTDAEAQLGAIMDFSGDGDDDTTEVDAAVSARAKEVSGG
jgi:hypothetical protein